MIAPDTSNFPFLIGIAGYSGSGKDTAAVYMENKLDDCYIEHFADPLKIACAEAFGMPIENFYDPELKEVRNEYWEATPREIAQFVGTELFRDSIHQLISFKKSFWVHRMYGKLSGEQRGTSDGDYCASDTVIIPDVRFLDEAAFITGNNGVLLHLTRPGASGMIGIPNHASENSLNFADHPSAICISNSGTYEELYAQLDEIIKTYCVKTPSISLF